MYFPVLFLLSVVMFQLAIMYFPVLFLIGMVHVSAGDWAPNGTWIKPVFCGTLECPPFYRLDDFTKVNP